LTNKQAIRDMVEVLTRPPVKIANSNQKEEESIEEIKEEEEAKETERIKSKMTLYTSEGFSPKK